MSKQRVPDRLEGPSPGDPKFQANREGSEATRPTPRLLHLFGIPVALGLSVLGVVALVLLAAGEGRSRTVVEILRDLRSGSTRERQRDAFEVARRLTFRAEADPTSVARLSSEEASVIEGLLADRSVDEITVSCLAVALGRSGPEKRAVAALASLLDSPAVSDRIRCHAIQALGLTRSHHAVAPLLDALAAAKGPPTWERRWYAVGALANLSQEILPEEKVRVVAQLRGQLHDPRREIAWNTACVLAHDFQDGAGVHLLNRLLTAGFLEAEETDAGRPFSRDLQDLWTQRALLALHRLRGDSAMSEVVREVRDRARRRQFARTLSTCYRLLESSSI